MKCFAFLIYLIIFTFRHSVNLSLKSSAADKKNAEEEVMSDQELDALLKDPKYAAIAGDLAIPSTTSDVKSSSSGAADIKTEKSNSGSSHYMSSSYKSHLDRLGKNKDIDLLGNSLTPDPLKDIDLMGIPKSDEDKSKDKKKNEVEEKFKNFDFISKQQARLLIEVLKQPVFFNMLPHEAQQIVKGVEDNFSFKFAENDKINDFIETSLVNSPNSQTFIDPDGIVGRKGIMTLIDPENGASKYVWAVSNAKVLTFFQSQSVLTIIKLYRNSSLVLKDIGATPCFLLSSTKESKDGSVLACATSTQEKEVWVQTVLSHLNRS